MKQPDANTPAGQLKAILSEHLSWHGARLTFLAHFLLAIIKVRNVNLAEIASAFGGKAKVDSTPNACNAYSVHSSSTTRNWRKSWCARYPSVRTAGI
jgi:hypothetical protein